MRKPNGAHGSLGSKWKRNQPAAFHSKNLLNVPLPADEAPPPVFVAGVAIATPPNADTGQSPPVYLFRAACLLSSAVSKDSFRHDTGVEAAATTSPISHVGRRKLPASGLGTVLDANEMNLHRLCQRKTKQNQRFPGSNVLG
jgi:hypothetical protein